MQLIIDSRILKDSKEFKSIFNDKKLDSIPHVADVGLNTTNENRGGAARGS